MHPEDSTNNAGEILSQCLQAIEAGEATIESCVAQFPDHPELVQLLSAITMVRELPRPSLSQADRGLMRQQVLAKYRSQQADLKSVHQDVSYRVPRWTQVAIGLGIAVGILLLLRRQPGMRRRFGDSRQRDSRS